MASIKLDILQSIERTKEAIFGTNRIQTGLKKSPNDK